MKETTNIYWTIKRYDCGHFYFKFSKKSRATRIKAAHYHKLMKQHKDNLYRNTVPYVTVTHKKTGRFFCLDRGYNLMEKRMACSQVSDWDGWKPTNESQMPAWAVPVPDEEFKAVWHY